MWRISRFLPEHSNNRVSPSDAIQFPEYLRTRNIPSPLPLEQRNFNISAKADLAISTATRENFPDVPSRYL